MEDLTFRSQQFQKITHKICINEICEKKDEKVNDQNDLKHKQICTQGTQTDYRDSETQTDLWIPSYLFTNTGRTTKIFLLKPGKL